MVVDFIERHPRRKVERGSKHTKALSERFSRVASRIAKAKVGGIDTHSGKVFLNTYRSVAASNRQAAKSILLNEAILILQNMPPK
jgi:hypothetical protein